MTRQQRIRQNEKLRNKYEEAFKPLVKKAIKNQLSSFTNDLKANGADVARNNLSVDLWNKELAPVINKLYVSAGLAKANVTLKELRRLPKVQKKRTTLGYNEEWTQAILNYFSASLFDKVVLPISDTTRDFIMEIMKQGIAEGWSIEEMVQRIEREDYLNGRVRRIVRTEANRAINYGNELAADKFEYKTQKRWIAVHDNRTRHAHLSADGQTVDQDGMYTVGGEQMEFPGDPKASGANTINCRCFSEVVAMRDANGRLIPKEGDRPTVRVRWALRAELQAILAGL